MLLIAWVAESVPRQTKIEYMVFAAVVELVDTQVSKTCEPLKLVSVRPRPAAPKV